jgi:dTDP-4-dehydrorhamnose reductase
VSADVRGRGADAGDRRRVLVIGASGQVGRALCASFADGYEVIGAGYQHGEGEQHRLDLSDRASLRSVWRAAQPSIVLLAGGMCHVDGCELDPSRSHAVNVAGTMAVAEEARASGALVVFYSTEHVFDGARDEYRESDAVCPINVYSRHKVEAEDGLRRALADDHLILRTSSVYGVDVHRRNFVVRFVDQLTAGRPMAVPDDQFGSPTQTEDLARATRLLVDAGRRGTFHATGPDYVARAAFAARICDRFGLDPSLIVARPARTLGQPAPRPRGVRLSCSTLAAAGVPSFMTIDEGLERLRAAMPALVVAR